MIDDILEFINSYLDEVRNNLLIPFDYSLGIECALKEIKKFIETKIKE